MKSVITQIRNIYFLSSQNIAINVYSNLINLIEYQKENPSNIISNIPLQILRPPSLSQDNHPIPQTSRSNYAIYINKVSGYELLVSLAYPIEEVVVNEIRLSSYWSLLVDESNTISTVIHNFHQILDDIHLALIQQKETNSMANFLHQALTTEFYITKFLADILATMKSMILVFQSDYVSLTETCKQLSMAIETITSDFIGSENSAPHYGIHLANYMNEYSLTGENLPITIKQFAQATIKSLRNRFPDSTLYYSIKILDPNEAPNNHDGLDTYGESEIKSLAEFYGKAKKNGSKIMCEPVLDGNTLIREWRMVRNIIYDYKNFWFIEAWYHIFNNNISFRDQFPNLTKLVELVLVVPVSNGVVERVFSHQNLIKTKLRNKMSIQTLNLHLHFSLNGPKDFSNYDYEKAYVYWNGVPRFNNQ
ncbi:hypothetical protein RclHR1_00060049 [Rhizophagus clarus]|uniref:HAT C-terminal dimerisation domain-containing protein n=1 Tax=Rhizophagus clarus TaxID=94130 RepID=A0A2Z6RQ52_9GLOM|nr:hypothetical protein RclHR1_00060049 [Rhizophagus clarus]